MLDITQILLIIVIITLTVILTLVGIQFYYLLKDLRITLRKANRILDSAENVSNLVSTEIAEIKNGLDNLLNVFSFLKFIRRNKN